MDEEYVKDVSDSTGKVLAGKADADCERTMLHVKYCEKCQKELTNK